MALDCIVITGTHRGERCRVKFTRRTDKQAGWICDVTAGKSISPARFVIHKDAKPCMATATTLCEYLLNSSQLTENRVLRLLSAKSFPGALHVLS